MAFLKGQGELGFWSQGWGNTLSPPSMPTYDSAIFYRSGIESRRPRLQNGTFYHPRFRDSFENCSVNNIFSAHSTCKRKLSFSSSNLSEVLQLISPTVVFERGTQSQIVSLNFYEYFNFFKYFRFLDGSYVSTEVFSNFTHRLLCQSWKYSEPTRGSRGRRPLQVVRP